MRPRHTANKIWILNVAYCGRSVKSVVAEDHVLLLVPFASYGLAEVRRDRGQLRQGE